MPRQRDLRRRRLDRPGAALDRRVPAGLLPAVGQWGQTLADSGIPDTLDHNDLHLNNVFAPLPGERRLRLLDFADGLVGHPFSSLLITLNVLRGSVPDHRASAVAEIRDAYLGQWTAYGDLPRLRAVAAAAMQVGRLNRLNVWLRLLPGMSPADRAEWGPWVLTWIAVLGAGPGA